MLLDRIIYPIALVYYHISKLKEKRLGYRLNFTQLPKNWLQGKVVFEMDSIWKSQGIDAIGTNYFTLGALQNGLSSRSDESSPLYQAWLGGYLVKFSTNRDWSINDHFSLAVADQKSWLQTYGDKKPEVRVDLDSVEDLEEINISGYSGKLYRGDIYSDTDVGNKKISLYYHFRICGMALYFNKSNSSLNVSSNNFIPNWNKEINIDPYENIKLRGYIAIINISKDIKAVLYANGAIFTNKQGHLVNHFKSIDKELQQLIKNIEIKPI